MSFFNGLIYNKMCYVPSLFPRGVKQTRGWRMSSHLKLQIIINVLFADKDGKRRYFYKTERDILPPPEIKYFVFDTDPAWGDDEE